MEEYHIDQDLDLASLNLLNEAILYKQTCIDCLIGSSIGLDQECLTYGLMFLLLYPCWVNIKTTLRYMVYLYYINQDYKHPVQEHLLFWLSPDSQKLWSQIYSIEQVDRYLDLVLVIHQNHLYNFFLFLFQVLILMLCYKHQDQVIFNNYLLLIFFYLSLFLFLINVSLSLNYRNLVRDLNYEHFLHF